MNHEQFNTIACNTSPKRILSSIELIKILQKYSSVKQKESLPLEPKEHGIALTSRQNEDILDHIDKELFEKDDKLITNFQVDPIENNEMTPPKKKIKNGSNSRQLTNFAKNRNRTTKGKDTGRSKSVNISPLRYNETEMSNQVVNSTANNKYKQTSYLNVNGRLKNISKFINKPKVSDKLTNDTSRSNSTTIYRKNKSTAIFNIPKTSKLFNASSKKPSISLSSANSKNNDKIIVDLQSMFGKKAEHLEAMYPNLSDSDKKNLITVLLSMSFDLKAELREEKAKNEQISKELQGKNKQCNMLTKDIEKIKKHSHNHLKLTKTSNNSIIKKQNHPRTLSQVSSNQFTCIYRYDANKVNKQK